ncbi:MAG: Response regulators consisting of a CheY-like receiver domain and a winged-helix DNA-binding domain [Rhodobacteraceae bacterium HLUCCO07]|nr:MAG: Response regulators consisting of a CheY-like receiver domain and a winged-helix DNA-binding domain [Rhodobacteraceae bacterium HLUCCO07]
MGKSVLLIEDEPNIVEAISFILSRDGWKVSTHANGQTALARIMETQPDVIILDVMLPGASGYDILSSLRSEPKTRELPVLVLTAHGQDRNREMAEEMGASRFMTKPFSNVDMLEAVRSLVAS